MDNTLIQKRFPLGLQTDTKMTQTKYLSDREVLNKFPYDRSDVASKHRCPCGEVWEISRDLSKDSVSRIKCRCGRPVNEWELIKQNHEHRLEVYYEREQASREAWKPWDPKEFLGLIQKDKK